GAQLTTLRPRSLAMLRYLLEHPGRLVTKSELRQHVWAGTHVTDSVLRASVQEIRAALGDAAAAPQYLETVGRQGDRGLGGGGLGEEAWGSRRRWRPDRSWGVRATSRPWSDWPSVPPRVPASSC